jgi:autophagy-related protein 5
MLSVQDGTSARTGNSPLPFKLTLYFSNTTNTISPSPIVMHDSFINSVKEADFLRSGTAKPIMTLPTGDSKALWVSTQENDLPTFARIHQSLLPGHGQLRNIPLRLYMPSSPEDGAGAAQMKMLQTHVPPSIPASSPNPALARGTTGSQPQTLGTALHTLIPTLFPSRRIPILARPLLHGAPLPMNSNLEELAKWACYADGWLSIVIAINA